jgi:hypothetical protein
MIVALLAGGADAASGSTGGVHADSAVEARGAERTLTDVSTRVPSTQDGVPLGAARALAPTDYTIEEFYDDFDGARLLLDQWWAAHWNDHFTGTYTSPGVITGGAFGDGLYDAPAESVFCGSTLLDEGNAYYCGPDVVPLGDFLAFEVDFMLESRTLGDAFVYMIVAHEWGHAVAARLDGGLQVPAYELQADCLGGAALSGVVADGLLTWEAGDDQEVIDGLTYIAGNGLPWGTVYLDEQGIERISTHGSAQERLDSFFLGVDGGVDACLPA